MPFLEKNHKNFPSLRVLLLDCFQPTIFPFIKFSNQHYVDFHISCLPSHHGGFTSQITSFLTFFCQNDVSIETIKLILGCWPKREFLLYRTAPHTRMITFANQRNPPRVHFHKIFSRWLLQIPQDEPKRGGRKITTSPGGVPETTT